MVISSLTTGSLMWEFKLTSGAAGSTPGPGSAAAPPPSEHTHTQVSHQCLSSVIIIVQEAEPGSQTWFISVTPVSGFKK